MQLSRHLTDQTVHEPPALATCQPVALSNGMPNISQLDPYKYAAFCSFLPRHRQLKDVHSFATGRVHTFLFPCSSNKDTTCMYSVTVSFSQAAGCHADQLSLLPTFPCVVSFHHVFNTWGMPSLRLSSETRLEGWKDQARLGSLCRPGRQSALVCPCTRLSSSGSSKSLPSLAGHAHYQVLFFAICFCGTTLVCIQRTVAPQCQIAFAVLASLWN